MVEEVRRYVRKGVSQGVSGSDGRESLGRREYSIMDTW
jgi:hypothetical protein